MPQLKDATTILNTLRSDLKREKEDLVTILKDPKITDWNTIDYKKYRSLLTSADIDINTIIESLTNYQLHAKKIGSKINDWNIEIGNQLADCIDHSSPETALTSAQKLADKVLSLASMKEEIQTIILPLLTADHCLRQQLGIAPVITIAKRLAPAKTDQLNTGAAILFLLSEPDNDKGNGESLITLREEPDRLEARIRRLAITKLPRLIEEVLFHHIENTLSTNHEIKIFLDTLAFRMRREINLIVTIKNDLLALQTESPAGLIKGIFTQGQITTNLLTSLSHKQHLQATIDNARFALDAISIFCSILKNRLIPALQKEVEITGSPLNPISSSTRMTRSFFEGTGGIIRSLKLMIKSLKGQATVNEIELQQILEKGIINCKTLFGNSHDDLEKIKHYINGMVVHYPKPFPYNDLFKLTKTTLWSYGAEVEKFIAEHDIPLDILGKIAPPPTGVGALIAAITKYSITFKKANADT